MKKQPVITITTPSGKRSIGPGHPVFVVGEISGNHNLSFDRAIELIDVARDAGVDAVKIQTYTADTLTIDCDTNLFQVKVNEAWAGETLYSLYQKAYTPWEWQADLCKYATQKGLTFFSTPFDETAVDFLETLNLPLYKVASFESTHIPLLRRIAATGKPIILSRGLTSETDLEFALFTLRREKCDSIAVLHCVSSYPAVASQMNLRTIPEIGRRFDVVTGFSDHSVTPESALTAVALGASVIEKHFTVRRSDGGPDAEFSVEPSELKDLVSSIRAVEAALGEATFEFDEKQKENIVFRRSIFTVRPVKSGEPLTADNIRIIRPGYGLAPRHYDEVLGRKAKHDLPRGTPIDWECLE